MRRTALLFLLFAGLSLAVWIAPSSFSRSERFEEPRAFIESLFATADAPQAYASLKERIAEQGESLPVHPHLYAHLFGESLYAHLGAAGFSVCDDALSFGCYHGFSLAAFETEGLNVLPELIDACRRAEGNLPGPCEHGLGHGLFLLSGDLHKALELCDYPGAPQIGGCRTGVFMEYNFPTSPDHTRIGTREMGSGSPHEPCLMVAPEHRPSCYVNQPQWWEKIFHYDYEKLGTLCEEAEYFSQRACFEGVGIRAAVHSEYDADKTVLLCGNMRSQEGRASCIRAATWIFVQENKSKDAYRLCDSLPQEEGAACRFALEENLRSKKAPGQ